MTVEFDNRIIVREEKDGFLLYNGNNGGLIRINKDAFTQVMSPQESGRESFPELYNWLYANDFLVEKPSRAEGEENSEQNFEEEQFRNRFFDLRSDVGPLNVLWAVTARCNLRCVYCFPDAKFHDTHFPQLSTDDLLLVAQKLIDAKVLKVTLSGGECLLRKDIWQVVAWLRAAGISVALISNGTTLSSTNIENLRNYGVHTGISLDAPTEAINQITRGARFFGKSVNAIRRLIANNIPTSVLVTLTRHNFPVLEQHLALLASMGVRIVTIQDLRPFGTREVYDQMRLTSVQEKGLKEKFDYLREQYPHILINPTELFIFNKQDANGKIMQCPAGENFAYIDFFADLYPCTHLPSYRMGNLLEQRSLCELWQDSDAAFQLRSLKNKALTEVSGCSGCSNREKCEGGCRGDALFYEGNPLGRPSRCPNQLGILG